jgi:hypothetical protein
MTEEVKFKVRGFDSYAGIPAETVADELARIYNNSGELTPDAVVEEATPEESPLHPAFEWDNEKAGHEHRKHQARNLIRKVEIVQAKIASPVYVHVNAEKPAYHPVELVVQRPDMFALALEELVGKLASSERSVQQLENAAKIGTDPDKLVLVSEIVQAFRFVSEKVQGLRH